MQAGIFFFQAEDGIRDAQESRGLGDVYKRQPSAGPSSPALLFAVVSLRRCRGSVASSSFSPAIPTPGSLSSSLHGVPRVGSPASSVLLGSSDFSSFSPSTRDGRPADQVQARR